MVLEDALTQVIREAVRDAVREIVPQALAAPRASSEADDLLTVSEAAVMAKLSAATIQKWLRAKKLTRYGKGRNSRVNRTELLAVLMQDGSSSAPAPERVGDQALQILNKRKR